MYNRGNLSDYTSIEKELNDFCDKYFENDSEVENYCRKMNIPTEETDNKA